MSLKFFEKLSQNFIELLHDKDDYNVIIQVENKEKSFTAHSNVLKFRSSYFSKELENIQPNENNIKIITKSNISAQIFDFILKYIYGGTVNLENVETRFIFDLMLAANEFELTELFKKLETILIEDKASWLKTHFSFVYHTVFDKENFKNLEKFCNDIVVKYPNLIFDGSDFTSLSESALVSLLKRDDLQMKEIKIWDYVIKWGVAQNTTLPTNLKEWTKDNFLTLKTTLKQCLPLIRYFHFSVDEVLNSIKPYKKIIDEQLWEDINQHLVTPKRPVKSIILPARSVLVTELPPRINEPNIISEDHAAEISSWIDRKTTTYSITNIPYKFELVLRGTKDGLAPQTFWNICHGHARTVVVAKVKGTDEIIGGYNPLAWDNTYNGEVNDWMKTKDSFIFSLKNGNLQNSILSRVIKPQYAILLVCKRNQKVCGPYFGFCFCMYSSKSNFNLDDLSFCNNTNNSYEKPIRTSGFFSIDNYEVFKVVQKS
ncbi:hypothetical protein Glove_130g154 [Diversispora epigaea]|uniref:BTB domain-containing protein n=1 Tax=Diversispora epigaea TaxID=1348612 RepID=A0A397J218_9GLOM|nr:hypothetical protein Glove_130g153 [Diversispora epigaea]RHZ80963.1 hypothetical protein Glove_130g154 [Diversispora epigaea]